MPGCLAASLDQGLEYFARLPCSYACACPQSMLCLLLVGISMTKNVLMRAKTNRAPATSFTLQVYTGGIGSYGLLVMVAAFLLMHPSRQPVDKRGRRAGVCSWRKDSSTLFACRLVINAVTMPVWLLHGAHATACSPSASDGAQTTLFWSTKHCRDTAACPLRDVQGLRTMRGRDTAASPLAMLVFRGPCMDQVAACTIRGTGVMVTTHRKAEQIVCGGMSVLVARHGRDKAACAQLSYCCNEEIGGMLAMRDASQGALNDSSITSVPDSRPDVLETKHASPSSHCLSMHHCTCVRCRRA